jgi:hypothetical protein
VRGLADQTGGAAHTTAAYQDADSLSLIKALRYLLSALRCQSQVNPARPANAEAKVEGLLAQWNALTGRRLRLHARLKRLEVARAVIALEQRREEGQSC